MKRTFALFAFAALLPLAAAAQVESGPAPAPPRYEAYAGFAYTSLNQVTLSRYGLMGGQLDLTRDWGRYFGLRGSGAYYRPPVASSTYSVAIVNGIPVYSGHRGNPGDPSVYSIVAGPELHADLLSSLSASFFAELGVEHTSGEGMMPATSFAGGYGGGLTYKLTNRWAMRATGDRLAASFSPNNNTPLLGYSTHRTWNPRATIGVVFRF